MEIEREGHVVHFSRLLLRTEQCRRKVAQRVARVFLPHKVESRNAARERRAQLQRLAQRAA